jgi:DNA-binding HxlR family transcriptional regulator
MNDISDIPNTCPSSLRTLGDFWTLYIVDVLRDDEVRFSDLNRKVVGINPVTLTDRLKKLETNGIVIRNIETVDKQSVTYSLTPLGRESLPIIDAYYRFATLLEGSSI